MNTFKGIGWVVWALVPVVVLAYHYGPGQHHDRRDAAVKRHLEAIDLETRASVIQAEAYEAHLAVMSSRMATFLPGNEDSGQELESAIAREQEAYARAADQWELVADAYKDVEELLEEDDVVQPRIRWAKARALVRSGDIWGGAGELEDLLHELDQTDSEGSQLARATREELASAHYFGARLLRLGGEPAMEWRAESAKARQHFRLLAESASSRGERMDVVRGFEDNVERVLDLEQLDLSDIQGMPLPRDSPRGTRGNRPGNGRPGITQRPPSQRDGRGAGGAGDIGSGW
ncbi:MAG: hypothetical protein MK085_12305 [Phycisphaerales bacterium]|nr:hypothetical protein [Phycisphaerales bacterium]